jgi:hypothetical protein
MPGWYDGGMPFLAHFDRRMPAPGGSMASATIGTIRGFFLSDLLMAETA